MVIRNAPNKGDIVFFTFDEQRGREQVGDRPALVLSPKTYNERVGLAVCCPITTHAKGYPFEVMLPKTMKTKGVVLSDHIKSFDWQMRGRRFLEHVPPSVLREVLAKLNLLLE